MDQPAKIAVDEDKWKKLRLSHHEYNLGFFDYGNLDLLFGLHVSPPDSATLSGSWRWFRGSSRVEGNVNGACDYVGVLQCVCVTLPRVIIPQKFMDLSLPASQNICQQCDEEECSSKYDSRIIEWVVGGFVVQCGKGRNPFSFTINRWWIRYREDFLGILWMFSICSR